MICLFLLLMQNLSDPALVSRGEQIFAQHCSVGYCHGAAGAAASAPQLRGRQLDRDYVHRVTRDGIPQSAMPGWKELLSDANIWAVVSYVLSLATATDPVPDPNAMPSGTGPATFIEFRGPPETAPGRELFLDATRKGRCVTCHSLGGRGIPVGPDLAAVAQESAERLFSLMSSHRPRHVVSVTLVSGEIFPSLRSSQSDGEIRVYDLTSVLPVLRTLDRSQVTSMVQNQTWSHRSAVDDYTEDDLRAIIPYIRWESGRGR